MVGRETLALTICVQITVLQPLTSMSTLVKLIVKHVVTGKLGIAVGKYYANGSTIKTLCYYVRWNDGGEDWYAATTLIILKDLYNEF